MVTNREQHHQQGTEWVQSCHPAVRPETFLNFLPVFDLTQCFSILFWKSSFLHIRPYGICCCCSRCSPVRGGDKGFKSAQFTSSLLTLEGLMERRRKCEEHFSRSKLLQTLPKRWAASTARKRALTIVCHLHQGGNYTRSNILVFIYKDRRRTSRSTFAKS